MRPWPGTARKLTISPVIPSAPDSSGLSGKPILPATHITDITSYPYFVCSHLSSYQEGMLSHLGHSIPVRHEGRIMEWQARPAFTGGIVESDILPRYCP